MRFPIDVSIVVGHPAMIGTGPIGGKAVETGRVIAGRDPVAVDSVGAYLLGFETLGVQHLHQAEQLGLGTAYSDPEKEGEPGRLKVKGLSVKVFRKAAYGEAFWLTSMAWRLASVGKKRSLAEHPPRIGGRRTEGPCRVDRTPG